MTRHPGRLWIAALLGALLTMIIPASLYASPPQPSPSPMLIQADASTELRIHKIFGSVWDQTSSPANGTPVNAPATAKPLAGVVFTVTRIDDVDLATNAGWQQAGVYSNNLSLARQHLGSAVRSAPTDSRGVTTVVGLPVGLYLVHEVGLVLPSGGVDPSIVAVPDFLVTLPMTDPVSRDRWMYTVDVYPKNEQLNVTKSVADGNAGVDGEDAPLPGHVLTYTLDAAIPTDGLRAFGGRCERNGRADTGSGLDEFGFNAAGMCASGATYIGVAAGAAYEIVDDLVGGTVPGTTPARPSSDFFEFSASDWTGAVTVSVGGGAPLTPCPAGSTTSCDYVLVRSASSVSVAMTDRGLGVVAATKARTASATVDVSLQARVRDSVADFTASGVLTVPNTAALVPNGLVKRAGTSVPSNTVQTIFAALRIHKVDQRSGHGLSGAVFTLYRTRDDAASGRNPLAVSAPTGADGQARFDGVHVTDFQNNSADNDSYWIVETKVPDGYIGGGAPIEVRIDSDGATVGADTTGGLPVANQPQDSTVTITTAPAVTNPPPVTMPPATIPPPSPLPTTPDGRMPRTGSEVFGTLGLGAALVAVGGIIVLVTRRRRRQLDENDAVGTTT